MAKYCDAPATCQEDYGLAGHHRMEKKKVCLGTIVSLVHHLEDLSSLSATRLCVLAPEATINFEEGFLSVKETLRDLSN